MAPKRKSAQKALDTLKDNQQEQDMDLDPTEEEEEHEAEQQDASEVGVGSDSEESDYDARQKKRARTNASSVAKGKGKGKATTTTKKVNNSKTNRLQYFKNMPLDIFNEIVSHLDPQALLNVARSTKSFHAILSSKTSRGIWMLARQNAGLPDLDAEDFSEMGYARLVYERNCYVCGKGRAMKVDYAVRARYCQPCQKANLGDPRQLKRACVTRGIELHRLAYEYSLYTDRSHTKRLKICHFLPNVRVISDKLKKLEKEHDEILAKAEEEESKPKKGKKSKGKGKEIVDTDSQETRPKTPYEVYLVERKKECRAAFDDGKAILKWELSSHKSRKEDQAALKKKRKEAIYAKLEELGHDSQDFPRWEGYLEHTKALTPQVWNKLEPVILESVRRNKTSRLHREKNQRQEERRRLLQPYFDTFKSTNIQQCQGYFPDFYSWVNDSALQETWKEEDAFIDDRKWQALEPIILINLAEFCSQHKRRAFVRLADNAFDAGRPAPYGPFKKVLDAITASEGNIVNPSWATLSDTDPVPRKINQKSTEILNLLEDDAMEPYFNSIFNHYRCSYCDTVHPYCEIMVHLNQAHPSAHPSAFLRAPAERGTEYIHGLSSLIKSAGLDEATVTEDDLVDLDSTIKCVTCALETFPLGRFDVYNLNWRNRNRGQYDELNWSAALKHLYTYHYMKSEAKLRVMTDEEIAVALAAK